MQRAKEIFNAALNKTVLNPKEQELVENLTEYYPFFQQAHLLKYKHYLGSESLKTDDALAELAIRTFDRTSLFNLKEQIINSNNELVDEDVDLVVQQNQLAIPGFKFTLNGTVEEADENAPMISDEIIEYEPQPTYSLEQEYEDQGLAKRTDRTAELIDGFLNKKRERRKPEVVLSKRPEDDSLKVPNDLVSETLAKIYVKQKKYTEAIALYEKLILLEPEKKSTFARSISEIKSKIE